MHREGARYLREREPAFAEHIDRIGEIVLKRKRATDPFESLVESIAYQQLAGAAARVIWGRVLALFAGSRPTAEKLLELDEQKLRGAGLSRGKIASMRDIAAQKITGVVPTRRSIARMSEQTIRERLLPIRGVGPWTIEMLLIFTLHRPDVMPATDYGVRKGFQILFKKRKLPTPRQLQKLTQRWSPHRTTAALYLWRIADGAKRVKPSKATARKSTRAASTGTASTGTASRGAASRGAVTRGAASTGGKANRAARKRR